LYTEVYYVQKNRVVRKLQFLNNFHIRIAFLQGKSSLLPEKMILAIGLVAMSTFAFGGMVFGAIAIGCLSYEAVAIGYYAHTVGNGYALGKYIFYH
jgi:hypothetical protein